MHVDRNKSDMLFLMFHCKNYSQLECPLVESKHVIVQSVWDAVSY